MRDPSRTALISLACLMLGALATGPALAQETLAVQAPSADAPFGQTASATVVRLDHWAVSSGDNQDMPFLIVDKPSAEVFVFDAAGNLLGSAPALLGESMGDDATPGVGDLELSDIPLDERTTEAGRFVARLGPAKGMKSVLWVNFDTSLSLHPVVTSNPQEQRLQRLKSPDPEERRITHGCINVPAAFYRDVVQQAFAGTKGVVYIVPDTKPVEEVFPALEHQADLGDGPRKHRKRSHDDDDLWSGAGPVATASPAAF